MATSRVFKCAQCSSEHVADTLFDALHRVAQRQAPRCTSCNITTDLHLHFDFALNASGNDQIVLGSFLPTHQQNWQHGESTVTFYPFLVITQGAGAEEGCVWLPYWHKVEDSANTEMKYGQWAPMMDMHLFVDLIKQAQVAGLLGLDVIPPAFTQMPPLTTHV